MHMVGLLLPWRSFDLDLKHPHPVAAGDLELMMLAFRAGVATPGNDDSFAAPHAPRRALALDDLEAGRVGQRTALDDLEGEAHPLDLDLGELADLEPNRGDTARAVRPSRLVDDLAHPLGERHLMHLRTRLGRGRRGRANEPCGRPDA